MKKLVRVKEVEEDQVVVHLLQVLLVLREDVHPLIPIKEQIVQLVVLEDD
jgi:hypothetical protein